MAFWGKTFAFNEIACEDFDLMLYDIGNTSQGAGKFASTVSIVEEFIPSRWKPFFYGVKYEDKLELSMVFGVNQRRLDKEKYLDRYELETIGAWLTGHDKYMWLEVQQDDLEYVRYRCIVTGLDIVEFGNIPWALKATIVCDSPYGYLYPQEYTYNISGSSQIVFDNESSHNGYYKPVIEISLNSEDDEEAEDTGGTFSIENVTDNNRKFQFSNVPTAVSTITIDNEKCVITSDSGLNLYPYFNFNFFRLVRGENILKITGNGTLKIKCEFPINAGG